MHKITTLCGCCILTLAACANPPQETEPHSRANGVNIITSIKSEDPLGFIIRKKALQDLSKNYPETMERLQTIEPLNIVGYKFLSNDRENYYMHGCTINNCDNKSSVIMDNNLVIKYIVHVDPPNKLKKENGKISIRILSAVNLAIVEFILTKEQSRCIRFFKSKCNVV